MELDFSKAMNIWITNILNEVHTVLPGRIAKYNGHSLRTAEVELMLKVPTFGNEYTEVKPIKGVPVLFPGSDRFNMLWSLKAGDPCLLLFSELPLGNFLKKEGISATAEKEIPEPAETTKFNLGDAICIPLSFFRSAKIPDTAANETDFYLEMGAKSVRISENQDVVELKTATSNLKLNAGVIELNGSSKQFVTHAELSTALSGFMTNLNLHTHTSAAPGSPTTPPIAPMSLDISSATTTKVKAGT